MEFDAFAGPERGLDSNLSETLNYSNEFDRFDDGWIDRPIFTRFRLIAARNPGKIALDDGVLQLTYQDVLRVAQNLALHVEATVPKGRTIGIFLPNGSLFPAAALACLAAGRLYVPIDQNYPPERTDQIIREARLAAIIIDRGNATARLTCSAIPQLDIGVSLVNKILPEISIAPVGGPAVVVYTSGSTGLPKGICIDQSAISQRVAQFTNTCKLGSNDRFILLSSPGTIAGIRDTFAALLNGATLYIADPHKGGMTGILRSLRDHRITVCYAVPALLRELLRLPAATQACADLRILRFGGDAVLASDIALCRASIPHSCRILVGYGSTEVPTIFQWFVPSEWPLDGSTIPCGCPTPDLAISLQKEDGTPASCGEVGEVVVRSRYLALGTWQNGELKSDVCQVEVEADDPTVRIIHTGDLARLRPDGLTELVGRKDRQLKIRGLLVDPGDVETILRRCDKVIDAVVCATNCGGIDSLVAYVVLSASAPSSTREHLSSLTRTLPGHMRPSRILVVDAIPRLPSFKPDIIALQKIEFSESKGNWPLAPQADTPATALEEQLLSICRQFLNAPDLGVSQNIFDAGANSLLAMKLMLEIESQLRLEISLETIFSRPTVRELCRALAESTDIKPAVILPIRSRQTDKTLYFTHSAFDFTTLSDALAGEISTAFVTTNGTKWLHRLIKGNDVLAAIDKISDAYAQAILENQKKGPCYLAGHSFGGILAVETACKLDERGAAPAIVFLFDTYLHGAIRRISFDILHNGWLTRKMSQFVRGDRQEILRRARFLSRNLFYGSTTAAILEKSDPTLGQGDLGLIFRRLREEASQAYQGPSRIPKSRIVLFRATKSVDGRTRQFDPDLGWARHLKTALTIIPSPGDHFNMMNGEHVGYVAREINSRI